MSDTKLTETENAVKADATNAETVIKAAEVKVVTVIKLHYAVIGAVICFAVGVIIGLTAHS